MFDAATGTRVTDATVTVTVHGLKRHPGEHLRLEPMTVAGAAAYGGFVTLPARDFYRISVEARRPGATPRSWQSSRTGTSSRDAAQYAGGDRWML